MEYISRYNEQSINLGKFVISSLETGELKVERNIKVGGLINGVNIVELNESVDELVQKTDNYVDLTSYQLISGNKAFNGNLTYFSNPAPNSVVVDGGIKTRVFETTSDGSATFTGPTAFYRNLDVKQNILMNDGATVDGVDVSLLGSQVSNHDSRITTIENEFDQLSVDYVDTKTAQYINGHKTFVNGITSRDDVAVHGNIIAVNPLVSGKLGTVRMGVGLMGGPDDADLILAGPETSVMFHNHYYFDEKNMNYDITCKADKKLYFNRGLAFPSAGSLMVFDGAANEIEVKADRFKISKSSGQVTAGVGVRTTNRAEMFFISNGDGVSEIFMGSDTDGSGRAEGNIKWDISSRDKANGRLIFYRGPGYSGSFDEKDVYTPGNYDTVMDFQNTKNATTHRYDCVINMNKSVNITGDLNVSGNLNFNTPFYTTDNWILGAVVGPGIKMRIGRSGRVVTMNVGAMSARSTPASDILITVVNALDPVFRPSMLVENIFMAYQNGKRLPAYIQVTTDGEVKFWFDWNGATTVTNPLSWKGFSTSWLA